MAGEDHHVRAAHQPADNTRRACSRDIAHFLAWGGRIPATPVSVASYLAEHAQALSYVTLRRRVVSLRLDGRIRLIDCPHRHTLKW
jgi:hypothetical protein